METFTGFEYLLIDACNTFGNDKWLFRDRIQWTLDHLDQLEDMVPQAETKPLFLKAVQAIRKAQTGQPSGHLVAFDACCSGLQIMSALTGCVNGASATGLIDPDRRADAYTEGTDRMGEILGGTIVMDRGPVKKAVMTAFYGSKKTPRDLFGSDTPELSAFYQMLKEMAPGATDLLEVLRDSWKSDALVHEWTLPDGLHARVKVMVTKQVPIEVDELDHLTFEYQFDENEPVKRGVANIANVVHSIDAYLLRSLLRRCNYDHSQAYFALKCMEAEKLSRHLGLSQEIELDEFWYPEWHTLCKSWQRNGMADVAILPYINRDTVTGMKDAHLSALLKVVNQMLTYKPFPVVTIHDSFAAHPNNVNWVRHWYKELLAELAESRIIDDILSQLYGFSGTFSRKCEDLSRLAEKIRASNYALS